MSNPTSMDLSSTSPPEDFSPPQQALWWLKKGDLKLGPEWETAHNICQSAEGDKTHDWIHALCHRSGKTWRIRSGSQRTMLTWR
jgi:hypothetical protein